MDLLDELGAEDWRLLTVARPRGFDLVLLLDDGPVLVASVDLDG